MVINGLFRQVVQGFPSIVVRIRRIAVHKWATIGSNWLEPFSVYSNLDFYDILGCVKMPSIQSYAINTALIVTAMFSFSRFSILA